MSKQDFEHWKRTKQLHRAGWRVEPVRTVQPHHGVETAAHFLLKAALAYVIEGRGRPWATEVEHPERGRADVLDWGPPDGFAVVYEIETECTPQREREKVRQYAGPLVRDVIVVPAGEVPASPAACAGWIERVVLGEPPATVRSAGAVPTLVTRPCYTGRQKVG